MNGSGFVVLDTNVVLYHLGDRLKQPLKKEKYAISVIVGLLESIKTQTIKLRRKYVLKTPDAIIATTAFKLNAPLLTNDKNC